MWLQWRLLARFAKASTLLCKQSKQIKRAFLYDLIDQAELAACVGDQRALYQIVKRLTPSVQKRASRMTDSQGRLLTAPEQLQAIKAYGDSVFAAQAEDPLPASCQATLS